MKKIGTIGIIGLGRMGLGFAHRLHQNNFSVIGYDPSESAQQTAAGQNIQIMPTEPSLAKESSIIFLLIPAGELIDTVLSGLIGVVQPGTIIIDAGNSKYTDSQRRATFLQQKNISFLDCGTSGGIHGKEQGYSLMIGGDKKIYEQLIPVFHALAAPDGFGYVGDSGAGHFVKMVHNGIEYALLQAYGEGFQLLKEGPYKNLDLAEITRIWNHGAVIRSWLLELSHEIFLKDQTLETISGHLAESGTGAWTVQTAHENKVPVPVIEKSLEVRAWSRKTGGNFATKVVALLRNAFGGHGYKRK